MQHLEISHHINNSTVFDRLKVAISPYPASPPMILHRGKREDMWQSPDHGMGVSWGWQSFLPMHIILFLSLSPRASNISGTTATLFSLFSVILIFFQSKSPCLRSPVLKSPGHHLPYCPTGLGSSSPILTWSSMTTRHLVHDRGLGQCNGRKEGRWAHFYKCFFLPLQAACLPWWRSCNPHQLLKRAVNHSLKSLSESLCKQQETPLAVAKLFNILCSVFFSFPPPFPPLQHS